MARKILLADDSVTAQNMGRKILADAGYEVITVNNGSAALKKIAESKPDVIVLDVYMPGYSGLEVCQRLKEAPDTSRIPVLLTVGKLEPFKPEEAKRVKAEGFIVKPFEASELLAALTKLEDKIVPRPEATKPGRFARANAAIEETRYGVPAEDEEDSGWRERIRFPSKAKKAEPEPEAQAEDTLYNPVNKDLRTTVERRPTSPHAVPYEQSRVDLGALVPEGLPKDVTPEEIAALAAAAAQVKARIEESHAARAQEPATPAQTSDQKPDVPRFEVKSEVMPEAQLVSASVAETKSEEKSEEKPIETVALQSTPEAQAEAAPIASVATAGAIEEPASRATFAVRESEESVGPAEQPSAAHQLSEVASPKAAEGVSALAEGVASSQDSEKPQEPEKTDVPAVAEMPAEKPITMAVAAGAEYLATPSRWQAVAVAISPEESGASLELEMARELEKAAQVAAAPVLVASPEPAPAAQSIVPVESASIVEAVVPEIFSPVAPSPELTPAVVESPAETMTPATPAPEPAPAVKHFEKVTPSHEGIRQASMESPATPEASTQVEDQAEPAPAVEAQADTPALTERAGTLDTEESVLTAQPIAEAPPEVPQRVSEAEGARIETPKSEPETVALETPGTAEPPAASPVASPEVSASAGHQESNIEAAKDAEPEPAVSEAATQPVPSEEPAGETPAVSAPVAEGVIAAPSHAEDCVEPSTSAPEPALAATAAPIESPSSSPKPEESVAGGFVDMAKKESEIAATTAAAWASWRRIRETDPKAAPAESATPQSDPKQSAVPSDTNAMAVAAGAEKVPQEAPAAEEPAEIENIVDSVLADLRPKIVAEISKKLKKKK